MHIKTTVTLLIFLLFSASVFADRIPETFEMKEKKVKALIERYTSIEKAHDKKYNKTLKDIERSYYLMLNKSLDVIPPKPKPKDLFETQYEYDKRMTAYKNKMNKAKLKQKKEARRIHKKYNLRYKTSLAEISYLEGKIEALKPVTEEIMAIQNQTVVLSGEPLTVTLFPPEADNFRFPLHITGKSKKWMEYWNYSDRNKARNIWKNKSYLKAEMRAQMELTAEGRLTMTPTVILVENKRTGDRKEFNIETVTPFPVISEYINLEKTELPAAKLMAALKNVVQGPVSGMEFIYISPRSYMRGSPRDEPGRWANEIQHKVTLTKGFYIMTTEVTQRQWRSVMGRNPSGFQQCGSDCPVENIYWGDVQEFIRRLNQMEKTTKYRLPTEAEWEFACRAGNKNFGANDDNEDRLKAYAWFFDNADGTPHPVAQKKPNRWGLFDMQGNVSEWCQDWAGPYPVDPVTDPKGPFRGQFRVARGGNWHMSSRSCRAADRNFNLPGDKSDAIGFRVVKSP